MCFGSKLSRVRVHISLIRMRGSFQQQNALLLRTLSLGRLLGSFCSNYFRLSMISCHDNLLQAQAKFLLVWGELLDCLGIYGLKPDIGSNIATFRTAGHELKAV